MPKPSAERLWERCLDIVKVNVTRQDYDTWFAPVTFDSLDSDNKTIVLRVPSHAIYETLEKQKRFRYLLYNVIWRVYGEDFIITYRILVDSTTNTTADVEGTRGSTAKETINRHTKKLKPSQESELQSQLNESYTFENFIEGAGNKLLRSVGISIATNPKQTTFNPLFIYGSSGVGKTHLVNAIGIEYKRNFPERRVLYVTANQFKVQFMTARQENKINDFIYFYQTIDVLIIDDIHEFAGLQGTQGTFFHIFNHLKMNGKQIILTSDRPPQSLPGVEERLLTRFKWGLSAELEKPDYELCRKILLSKIRQDGLQVGDDVAEFVARNVCGSIRDLEGTLSSLMAYSLVFNQDINMEMARQVVGKAMKAQTRTVTIDMIIDRACSFFDIGESEIMAKGRKASVVIVRQLIMYLAHRHTKLTASRIGLRIGGRSHATVIHAVKQVERQLTEDKAFERRVAELEAMLGDGKR
ncbi:MAG: chromosomal replication initiator protein DnaA [Prevotellaceae bacterium]|nr:chromosomal replication initiator protein DnaA [Prevotellaceae bacterium]